MSQDATWTAEGPDAIETLADLLAKNYLDLSVRFYDDSQEDREQIRTAAKRVITEDRAFDLSKLPRSRTLLVLGAGASVGAFGREAFPTTDIAKEEIDKILEVDTKIGGEGGDSIRNLVKREKERLDMYYGFKRASEDFETHLAVLSSIFSPELVRSALSGLYEQRHWPHLTFELIAHLLKHRFIDAVVNFNFDELLDQAIEEEIGRGQYHYVLSDGDCRGLDAIMVGKRLKVPLHIKPHGTVSHQSTLRFTKDHYYLLPEDMRLFMEKIVKGHREDDEVESTGYSVTILSVGFGMESLDLLGMLKEASEGQDYRMFHFNLGGTLDLERLIDATGIKKQYMIDVGGSNDYRGYRGLEGALRALWDHTCERFDRDFRPRGVDRHEIVHDLFYRQPAAVPGHRVPRGKERLSGSTSWEGGADGSYAFARLCAELAIALAKGNGRLDLSTVADSRIGTYAELALATHPTDESPIQRAIDCFKEAGLTLKDDERYTHEVLTADITFGVSTDARSVNEGIARKLWEALRAVLKNLGNEDLREQIESLSARDEKKMLDRFENLARSDTQTLSPRFEPRHLLRRKTISPDNVLHTNLAISLRFVEMVVQKEWDVFLGVSEFGKVIDWYGEHARNGRVPGLTSKWVSLVVAENRPGVNEKRLGAYEKCLLGPPDRSPSFYELPFWAHNHHMAILLKRNSGNSGGMPFKPVAAIQYRKEGLNDQVNAVYVEERVDLDMLVDIFFGQVFDAMTYMESCKNGRPRSLPAASLEHAIETRETLLADWWERTGPS